MCYFKSPHLSAMGVLTAVAFYLTPGAYSDSSITGLWTSRAVCFTPFSSSYPSPLVDCGTVVASSSSSNNYI